MTSYAYQPSTSDVMLEAFDRCRVRPTAITRDQIMSGLRSLNLELLSWSNLGVNLWKVQAFTIQIVANQATYVAGTGVTNIPEQAVSMLECYYSIINGGGAGVNIDRIMLPMSRTQYDELPNKSQSGNQPSLFWFEKLNSPRVTFWQPPLDGYPTAQISGHVLAQVSRASLGDGATPDIPYQAYDALCAKLAQRLARKFVDDPKLRDEIKADATEAWELFSDTNREDVNLTIMPDMGTYYGSD